MPKSDDLQELFDASQEVVREAFDAAVRVAERRGLDPQKVIRASFPQLQAMGFALGLGGEPPKRPPRSKAADSLRRSSNA
jgi:hypothetical protein